MIRQPKQELLNRLTVKTLDQVFVARVREGLNCSLFEAQALTELVKEVYFPWLAPSETIQAGVSGSGGTVQPLTSPCQCVRL